MGNEIVPQAYGMIGASGQEGASAEEQPAITASHGQPGNVGYRMTAFGQYEDDNTASTLKQRDHKDATDLVAQAFNWQSGGDGRGLDLTDETSALTTQQTPAVLLPEAKMLFVRNGVEVDRHGKKAGKGALIATEEAPTLDAGNHWALFQPHAFDEMNFTTDPDTHHVLRAGTPQSTGVLQPQAFRKASRAHGTDSDEFATAESWVADGQANTLNTFDMGDTRTTHAIVETLAPSLTASNDPSRSPQSSEVTQQVATVHASGYGVRRLTPVECERLQAFPDGWTEPAVSDSARYKALGNAVTVNTVRWVLGRMLEQSGEAIQTMSTPVQSQAVKAAAMLNFQGSKGNNVTNDGSESFTLNAMHGHDVHAVVVEKS
jgi:site-specific DNA-cytosine methylase